MRTRYLIVLALALVLSPPVGGNELRQIEGSFGLDGRTELRLDFPVAELRVAGSDGEKVDVEVVATCKRGSSCKDVLSDLELRDTKSRNTLRIDLEGYPKWGKGRVEIEAVVRAPRAIDIEIELGVGEIELKGLTGNLRTELGVGEINAWLPRSAVRSVTLDAGVGEAELYGVDRRVQGRRSMLVGSEVHWDEGEGTRRVFLEVGVGEISVWLD